MYRKPQKDDIYDKIFSFRFSNIFPFCTPQHILDLTIRPLTIVEQFLSVFTLWLFVCFAFFGSKHFRTSRISLFFPNRSTNHQWIYARYEYWPTIIFLMSWVRGLVPLGLLAQQLLFQNYLETYFQSFQITKWIVWYHCYLNFQTVYVNPSVVQPCHQ